MKVLCMHSEYKSKLIINLRLLLNAVTHLIEKEY